LIAGQADELNFLEAGVYFRQLLNDHTACASYLLGCKTSGEFAVVDPHVDLVDDYVALAEAQGAAIVAVFDTHVQADHVSGLPALVACTAAAAYLPAGAGVEFDHRPLTDGEVVMLGNVDIAAIATPGQALAHHAYVITDRTRGDEPWLVLTGKPYGQRTGVASRADRRDPPPPLGAGSSPRPCPRGQRDDPSNAGFPVSHRPL